MFKEWMMPRFNGEWWIDSDGRSHYCDGDVGDVGHELYIIEMLKSEFTDEQESYDEAKERLAKEKYEEILEKTRHPEQIQKVKDMYEDEPEKFAWMAMKELGVKRDNIMALEGAYGDLRLWAMKKWGWKTLRETNVQTFTMTPNDLKIIAKGFTDAYSNELDSEESDEEEVEIEIENMQNNQIYTATLENLKHGRLASQPILQTPLQKQAYNKALDNYDKPSNPFYKKFEHFRLRHK